MGQRWLIANLDKKESTPQLGKLSEFFFSTPQLLTQFLAFTTAPTRDARVGSWAGDRVICIGDYNKVYPKGMLTSEEFARLGDDITLYDLISHEYGTVTLFSGKAEVALPGGVWVLRNLSKKEYVRSDVVESYHIEKNGKSEHRPHPLLVRPGLSHVMLSKIAWSVDPRRSSPPSGAYVWSQGVWAGDKIDLVPLDFMWSRIGGDESSWKDVSYPAAVEIDGLWNDS